MCYDRQLYKARVNEDNQVIWKDVALQFITDPSNIAEVSAGIYCKHLHVKYQYKSVLDLF